MKFVATIVMTFTYLCSTPVPLIQLYLNITHIIISVTSGAQVCYSSSDTISDPIECTQTYDFPLSTLSVTTKYGALGGVVIPLNTWMEALLGVPNATPPVTLCLDKCELNI